MLLVKVVEPVWTETAAYRQLYRSKEAPRGDLIVTLTAEYYATLHVERIMGNGFKAKVGC